MSTTPRPRPRKAGIASRSTTSPISSTIPGPWSYAELSEIHVSKFGFDGILLEIMLWSEDAGLSIAARSARLDDAEMIPGG
jgi:hypothetical protein